MRFNPLTLNRAWQSIEAAAGTDKKNTSTYRAVTIEMHDDGMWLIGTDGSLLLHAWVPNHTHSVYDPAPDRSVPGQQVVACDPGHRALSLIAYVAKLADDDGVDPDDYLIEVTIEEVAASSTAFPGMENLIVAVSSDTETVTLDTWGGAPTAWRTIIDHAPGDTPTRATSLHPPAMAKLVKAAKPHELSSIAASFSGLNEPIMVEIVNSEPYVSGVLMPVRIDTATDSQAA